MLQRILDQVSGQDRESVEIDVRKDRGVGKYQLNAPGVVGARRHFAHDQSQDRSHVNRLRRLETPAFGPCQLHQLFRQPGEPP